MEKNQLVALLCSLGLISIGVSQISNQNYLSISFEIIGCVLIFVGVIKFFAQSHGNEGKN
jgi:hypothetical protein